MPFHPLQSIHTKALVSNRQGEKKLNALLEASPTPADQTDWSAFSQKYVLLGLCEDIGVRANLGRPGASGAYWAFLQSFINQQINSAFNPEDILMGGHYEKDTSATELKTLRQLVGTIDEEIAPVIENIIKADKIPILIGGGHNNAYPAMKGLHRATGCPLSIVNFDAHTDFRDLEGRHSGNAFSYARKEGFLKEYWVVGLSEAYTSQSILDAFDQWNGAHVVSYENIYVQRQFDLSTVLERLSLLPDDPAHVLGVEIDMDVIERFPSSAMNSVGMPLSDILHSVHFLSKKTQVGYYHICEAAPALAQEGGRIVGRALSAIVSQILADKN